MAEEVASESEKAQIQRLLTIQKVALRIILKWKWLFIVLLVALGWAFVCLLKERSATSLSRYEATTQLLFSPQKVAKIDTISDRQLMSIIVRPSLKARVGTRLGLSVSEIRQLEDMTITQERRPTNLFTLTATGPTRQAAIERANAYAEVLIDEYVTFRSYDLENRRTSLEARRRKILERLAENDAELSKLKAKTSIAAPAEALATLNTLISDQRRNLASISVDIANVEMRRQKQEALVGSIGPVIIANAAAIRRRSEAIAALDKELATLRMTYTDLNPKVVGVMHDRDEQVKEMQQFLKSKGVGDFDVDRINEVEAAAGELASCGTRLEALAERQRALERELSDNEKKAEQLTALVPEHERLTTIHNDLEHSVRKLDDDMNDLTYLMSSLRNDLRQIERAEGAMDNGGVAFKRLAAALLGAVICVGALLFWVLLLEFVFGNVCGGKELAAYHNVNFLGSLPREQKQLSSEMREALGVLALRLLGADAPRGVMLICSLRGASRNENFNEVLDYTASMSGVRIFTLDIVSNSSFAPPDASEQMIGTVRKDVRGWFPVQNRFALAPTELEMLKADLAELRNSFDTVFLCMEGGFRKGGAFFDQLLSISETVILMVGASRTPRSWFRYVCRHVETVGKPILAIATDASVGVVRAEMDAQ